MAGNNTRSHGETANARWQFRSLETAAGRSCLHLSLATKVRPGRVDKRIWLVEGQNTVYSQHVVSGMSGPMNLGHHAMLKFPDAPGSGLVSTSRFVYGQVFPRAFEFPEHRGYSCLKPGAEFKSLEKVPTLTGETTDLTRYPARRGFEDLVMLVSDAQAPFAWTAVTFPAERYVWFALKDPRVLRENGLLALQRRTALSAVERSACQRDGTGGSDLVFPSRFGGGRSPKPPLEEGRSEPA